MQLNVGYYISLACCDQIRTNTCVVSESPPYLSTGRSINFVASSLFTSLYVHVDRINKVMCVVCCVFCFVFNARRCGPVSVSVCRKSEFYLNG